MWLCPLCPDHWPLISSRFLAKEEWRGSSTFCRTHMSTRGWVRQQWCLRSQGSGYEQSHGYVVNPEPLGRASVQEVHVWSGAAGSWLSVQQRKQAQALLDWQIETVAVWANSDLQSDLTCQTQVSLPALKWLHYIQVYQGLAAMYTGSQAQLNVTEPSLVLLGTGVLFLLLKRSTAYYNSANATLIKYTTTRNR